MGKLLVTAVAVAGAAALSLSSRRELQRYLAIKRAGHDPAAVGQSITPQGNEAALSRAQRHHRR